MTRDLVAEALGLLGQEEASPRAEFTDALLTRFLEEATREVPREVEPSFAPPTRRPLWRRMVAPIAAALTLAIVAAIVLGALPGGGPSALALIREARQRFQQIPAFRASVVHRQFGELIGEERRLEPGTVPDLVLEREISYLDDRHFLVEVVRNSYDGDTGPWVDVHGDRSAGSFTVADGTYLADYLAKSGELLVGSIDDEKVADLRREGTQLLDPSLHAFGDFSDPFYRDHCDARPDEQVAGRTAHRIHCEDAEAAGTSFDVWLDAETGFVLRIDISGVITGSGLLDVEGTALEVRSIEYEPAFAPDAFELQIPEGARVLWAGPPPIPEPFRMEVDPEVSARIELRGRGGPLVFAGGWLWATGVEGGRGDDFTEGRGYVARIDPATGEVLGRTVLDPVHEEEPKGYVSHLVEVADMAADDRYLWVGEWHAGVDRYDEKEQIWHYRFRVSRIGLATGDPVGKAADFVGRSGGIAPADDGIWLATPLTRTVIVGPAYFDYGSVVRLDPETGEVQDVFDLEGRPYGGTNVVAEGSSLWLSWWEPNLADVYALGRNVLLEFDRKKGEVVRTIDLPVAAYDDEGTQGMVVVDDTLWIATDDRGKGVLLEVDLRRGKVVGTARVGTAPTGIAYGEGYLWIVDFEEDALYQVDPDKMKVVGEAIKTGPQPVAVAVAEGSVWVSHFGDGSVARVDIFTG